MKRQNPSTSRKALSRPKSNSSRKQTSLGRILDPMDVQEFVASYFERRPLVVRGKRDKFTSVFTPEEFKFGLDRVTEIRAVFSGLWQASIHPADIKEMINAGASICVTGLEAAHPKLLKMAESIRKDLNYTGRVTFRSYLSPPGAGFDLHFDARVATTLQIAGSKRWWFSLLPAEVFPERNSPRDRKVLKRQYALPNRREMRSVLLRPGDLLCLPAGTWHRAEAKTTSLALNLAFDHNGSGVFDVIIDALEGKLRKDPAWRAPLPLVTQTKRNSLPPQIATILCQRIESLQRILAEMRDDDVALRRAWKNSLDPK